MRLDPYLAMIALYDIFADTETIAGTGIFVHTIELAERLKDSPMVFRIDTDTIVFDTKLPVAAVFASEYLDIWTLIFFVKFKGIVYQME